MSGPYSLYEEAQLLMAGVRVFRHREERFPSVKELADLLGLSLESVHHLCNRLQRVGAVERIQGAFAERVALLDPLQAEALRQEEGPADIGDDVKKWKEQREGAMQEVEKRFSADFGRKEKEGLYSQLEEKIRRGGKEERTSPLDALFKTRTPGEKP